jgi:hypothetical protein
MLNDAVKYVTVGLLMWFMVATVALLLITMDAGNRNRTPRTTTIVVLLPAFLVLIIGNAVDRILKRILFTDDADDASDQGAANPKRRE